MKRLQASLSEANAQLSMMQAEKMLPGVEQASANDGEVKRLASLSEAQQSELCATARLQAMGAAEVDSPRMDRATKEGHRLDGTGQRRFDAGLSAVHTGWIATE